MLMKQSRAENDQNAGEIGEEVNVAAFFKVFEIVMRSTAQ